MFHVKPKIMEIDKIKKLLDIANISDEQLEKIKQYGDLLLEWNQKINLTAIREEREIYLKHFKDSAATLELINQLQPTNIMDIGSGGGFPGLVLAIMLPQIKFTLVESITKKTNFICLVKDELQLNNVTVLTARVEDLYGDKFHYEKPEIITGRAVFYLPIFLELSLGLLHDEGHIITYKAIDTLKEELGDAKDFISMYNLKLENRIDYQIDKNSRTILDFKAGKIPTDFKPRRLKKLKNIYKRR